MALTPLPQRNRRRGRRRRHHALHRNRRLCSALCRSCRCSRGARFATGASPRRHDARSAAHRVALSQEWRVSRAARCVAKRQDAARAVRSGSSLAHTALGVCAHCHRCRAHYYPRSVCTGHSQVNSARSFCRVRCAVPSGVLGFAPPSISLAAVRSSLRRLAGGSKYAAAGIFFKYAHDVYGIYGGNEAAAKAAGHEARSHAALAGKQSGRSLVSAAHRTSAACSAGHISLAPTNVHCARLPRLSAHLHGAAAHQRPHAAVRLCRRRSTCALSTPRHRGVCRRHGPGALSQTTPRRSPTARSSTGELVFFGESTNDA